MSRIVTIAGVDRTSTVDAVNDLSCEDVRSASIPSLTLALKAWEEPWATTKPTGGLAVTVTDDGRTLFAGLITEVTYKRRGQSRFYHHICTVTSIKMLLDRPRIYKRYTGTRYQDEVLVDAPVGYWRMGEAAGTTLVDGSGFGRSGTYSATGVTYGATGAVADDTAVTFDGAAGKATVTAATALDVVDTFTVEAWIRKHLDGVAQSIVNHGAKSFDVWCDSDNKIALSKTGVARAATSSATVTADGQWHHIVVTKNGGLPTIYIDGVDRTDATVAQTLEDNNLGLWIGVHSAGVQYFDGGIDDVALYPTALSAARVAAHYAARTRTGLSGSDIAADLMASAPAGFTLSCEAGLPDIDEIVYDGDTLHQAFQKLADYLGGAAYYVDENWVVHLALESEAGVEQPDTVTLANLEEVSRTIDYSQIVTRQCVEGKGTTLAAPLSVGDTAIIPADASIFDASGVVSLRSSPRRRYAYSSRDDWKVRTSVSGTNYAGQHFLNVASIANVPSSGWVLVNGTIPVRFYGIDIRTGGVSVLLLRGAYRIASITRSGTTATLTTIGDPPIFDAANGITFDGAGSAPWGPNTYGTVWATANPNVWQFNCLGTEPNIANTGFVYASYGTTAWLPTATISRSGRIATAACSRCHFAKVGEWVTVSGCSEPEYDGTHLVTAAPDSTHLCFEVAGTPGVGTAATIVLVGGIPSQLTAGWNVDLCRGLKGVTVVEAAAQGTALHAFAQCDDLVAQAALAALEGTDGIVEGQVIADENLSATGCKARGDAELAVRSTAETRLSYQSKDPKTRAGTGVTANIVTPHLTIDGSHRIVKVTFSRMTKGDGITTLRQVETSDKRYSGLDLYRQLATNQ